MTSHGFANKHMITHDCCLYFVHVLFLFCFVCFVLLFGLQKGGGNQRRNKVSLQHKEKEKEKQVSNKCLRNTHKYNLQTPHRVDPHQQPQTHRDKTRLLRFPSIRDF